VRSRKSNSVCPSIWVEGPCRLKGRVEVGGSKNSTLAILASCLLLKGETVLRGVPGIVDILTMLEMLSRLGAKAEFVDRDTVLIDATNLQSSDAPSDLVKKMRASFSVTGPLLARLGRVSTPLPGGCDIGARPVNFHTQGLEALGAEIKIEHGWVEATTRKKLRGETIYLDYPSSGATSHLATAACLAEGTTVIENAAVEPEIVDLVAFLRGCGAKISGEGTTALKIEGVKELHGTEHRVMPDRMEAATFAVAAAATRGDLRIEFPHLDRMRPVSEKLKSAGAEIAEDDGGFRVKMARRPKAVDVKTMPYPGFPTDVQQQVAAMLSCADGTSVITETVYERRFKYVSELVRMGADIKLNGNTAILRGVDHLSSATVAATDLRAGAALVIAGLMAEGKTEIAGTEHIDRGYADLVEKVRSIGGRIGRSGEDDLVEQKRCSA
jgi:UDP-N-acetylglucosamine 1-carboxyvinyltransferase